MNLNLVIISYTYEIFFFYCRFNALSATRRGEPSVKPKTYRSSPLTVTLRINIKKNVYLNYKL